MDEIEPKFGEWLRGIYASESNPRRDGMYVRTIRRTGKLNPGVHYEVTDGNGKFWQYPAQSVERLATPPTVQVQHDYLSAELAGMTAAYERMIAYTVVHKGQLVYMSDLGRAAYSDVVAERDAALRAADNRDAAGVDDSLRMRLIDLLFTEAAAQTETGITGLADKILAMIDAPAAVPAGEAVAACGTCNGVGMIGGHRGQTPDSFEQWAEDCPDCTPQPAGGEAVAEWRQSPYGDYPSLSWLANYKARVGDKLYLHPPTPPAAQEQAEDFVHGEYIRGYNDAVKNMSAAQVQQVAGMNGEAVAVYQLSFEVEGRGWQDTDKATFDFWQGKDRVSRVLYTHPAADALGAVRELVEKYRGFADSGSHVANDYGAGQRWAYGVAAAELEAALAQAPAVRGDAQ